MEEERRGANESESSRRGGDVRRKEWRMLSFISFKEIAVRMLPLGRRGWKGKTGFQFWVKFNRIFLEINQEN